MQRRSTTRRIGFTLIELLVVIAIIAILAAILFPVFAQARAKARAISCLSNLKQLGTASMMYLQDYDETYPSGWNWSGSTQAEATRNQLMWRTSLQPYVQKYGNQGDCYDASKSFGMFACPDAPTSAAAGPTSYGYNGSQLTDSNFVETPNAGYAYIGAGKAQAAINKPASLVAFSDAAEQSQSASLDANFDQGKGVCDIDAQTGDCGPYAFKPETWKMNNPWQSVDWDFSVPGVAGRMGGDDDWSGSYGRARRPMFRHQGRANVVFADGHAKSVGGGSLAAKLGSADDIWHNHNR